jgi:hypothetical protein
MGGLLDAVVQPALMQPAWVGFTLKIEAIPSRAQSGTPRTVTREPAALRACSENNIRRAP